MLTQLLWGEECEVLEQVPRWIRIHAKGDGQEGWVDAKMMSNEDWPVRPKRLSMGTRVPEGIVYSGDKILTAALTMSRERLVEVYGVLEGTPYLWGGKNEWGMDCSGMTQVVMSLFGIRLLRNASEQATQGQAVASLSEARTGDLVLFDHADIDPTQTRISHVGILMDTHTVMHCSGWVRTDRIDEQGIINDKGQYTHHLASVRHLGRKRLTALPSSGDQGLHSPKKSADFFG